MNRTLKSSTRLHLSTKKDSSSSPLTSTSSTSSSISSTSSSSSSSFSSSSSRTRRLQRLKLEAFHQLRTQIEREQNCMIQRLRILDSYSLVEQQRLMLESITTAANTTPAPSSPSVSCSASSCSAAATFVDTVDTPMSPSSPSISMTDSNDLMIVSHSNSNSATTASSGPATATAIAPAPSVDKDIQFLLENICTLSTRDFSEVLDFEVDLISQEYDSCVGDLF
ncbi:hypothetical protein HK102_007454 [Quaeritorhiza haematococci]|nr:hypothetical protein HK102_007454 [Quaeritorhiza haematococci]